MIGHKQNMQEIHRKHSYSYYSNLISFSINIFKREKSILLNKIFSYGEDVKWLLQVSKKLGTQYLHQFCICAVNSIVSPFVLHDVAIEVAHYLSRNNPTLFMQHLRSALTPLVQKCQQM